MQVAEEGELEAREVDHGGNGCAHRRTERARCMTKLSPRLLGSQRAFGAPIPNPRQATYDPRNVRPLGKRDPMNLHFVGVAAGMNDRPADLQKGTEGRRGTRRLTIDDQDVEIGECPHGARLGRALAPRPDRWCESGPLRLPS
jgi:hypothetical protein